MPNGAIKEKRLLSFLFRKSEIANRHSVIPDFNLKCAAPELFLSNKTSTPSIDARMQIYCDKAPILVSKAIDKCLKGIENKDITHVITVTCTGLAAPGLDVDIVERLGLSDMVQRSSVNFMGCHGGFHALKQAFYICQHQKNANVLIASVELSTIHFQSDTSSDHMLANTLFADGAAAVLISGDDSLHHGNYKIANFHSKLLLKGKSAMAWKISSRGFLMNLSTQVPELISDDFHQILTPIFEKYLPNHVFNDVLWAFHPGGVRVLESITKMAGITKEQMAASYAVLNQFGNMSSCTIFFVLERMMEHMIASNKPIIAAGFGPGLSMEAMILKSNQ
jgi:predicted naringenin-chalcone synthase